jgi:two-component system chemotaxis sensor kinase CheA
MEDMDRGLFHQLGGRLCVSVDDNLYDVKGLDTLPQTDSVKLLRLSDGSATVFLAVADVIDIFALDGEIAPSRLPELYEGIVHVDGKPVEILNSYSFFEANPNEVRSHDSQRPLCFIDAARNDGWEQNVLGPLLTATGYEISFDEADRERAAVVLVRGASTGDLPQDGRLVALRDTVQTGADEQGSIYRYDRMALLTAIESKVAGAR